MHWIGWSRWVGILLLSSVGVGGGSEALKAQETENTYTTRFDVNMGERLFLRQCSRCHGQDAKGNDETGAPDLTTGQYSNASSPSGVFDVIRNGVLGTAMLPITPETTEVSVWQLVSYLDSLATNPADIDLPGSPSRGKQVYDSKGECTRCHIVNGEGGRQGPDLSRVGERRNPDELLLDLIDPSKDVEPRWWTISVTRNNGSTIEGSRMSEDTFTLRVMDLEENLWSFSKSNIQGFERFEESTMPSYDQTLSSGELDDLVAYLFSLRKEISP